ncbi:hypothetical protein TRFO_04265 [Tritrichomonas foetus]|uniref:Uncharacterized protein n=1 Tax=Tritrichomonas foetus TaxID=1144522 RepID=A0A1J4KFS0_9EUKA|nr:hypothetical protein TRFO_04265 [Tritrichomonas foetus]|eukprot:OHT10257.1 hypothetical protein TRFO_04265 [Tritrichomonas foetus]
MIKIQLVHVFTFFLALSSVLLYASWINPKYHLLIQTKEFSTEYDSTCLLRMTDLSEAFHYKKHFIHDTYNELMPCIFDLNYNFTANNYIIVFGSNSQIGIQLINILKEKKLNFIEIKDNIHFNIKNKPLFEIIDNMHCCLMFIDLNLLNRKKTQNDDHSDHIGSHEQIMTSTNESRIIDVYAERRKIPLIRVIPDTFNVSKYLTNFSYSLIIPSNIFGPEYNPQNNCIQKALYNCIINNSFNQFCNTDKHYCLASDIALFIYKGIDDYLNNRALFHQYQMKYTNNFQNSNNQSSYFHMNSDFKVINLLKQNILKMYQERKLFSVLKDICPNCFLNNTFIISQNDEKIRFKKKECEAISKNILTITNNLLPNLSKPYVSHVTTLSNLQRVLRCYQINVNMIGQIMALYPLISVEFIIVFSSLKDENFDDLIKIPNILKKYYNCVKISSITQQMIHHKVASEFFPEYVFRNIGVKRARGEYIICGSSDVLMPPAFFMAAEQKLFSPLSYIRSIRENVEPKEIQKVLVDFNDLLSTEIFWADTNHGFQLMANSLLSNACGDFQGCHRLMWNILHAYIENNMIYHVDSIFGFDLTLFNAKILIRYLPGEKHINHIKISTKTPHLNIYTLNSRALIYNGFNSKDIMKRRFWGYGEIT